MLHRPQLILIAALFAAALVSASGRPQPRESQPRTGNTQGKIELYEDERSSSSRVTGPNTGAFSDSDSPSQSPRTSVQTGSLTRVGSRHQQILQRTAHYSHVQQHRQQREQTMVQQQQGQGQSPFSASSPVVGQLPSPTSPQQSVNLLDMQYPHSNQLYHPQTGKPNFSLPSVQPGKHIHTKFMLAPPYGNSVLAADQAVDYVVAFLGAYGRVQVAQSVEQRLEIVAQMQSYIQAIGGLIEYIEQLGYKGMDNALAVKTIQSRVAALKIDLSGLSLLAKTVPELRFENVHHYVEQGEKHAKANQEQMGWWKSLWQGAKGVQSYASKWIPRRVTREELLAIRQQAGVREQRVMEQHAALGKLEPNIEPQQQAFAQPGNVPLQPQTAQQQQFQQGFPAQGGQFNGHFNPMFQQQGFLPQDGQFNNGHFNPTYQPPPYPGQFQQGLGQQQQQQQQGFGQPQPFEFGQTQPFTFGPQQGFGPTTPQQQPQQRFGQQGDGFANK